MILAQVNRSVWQQYLPYFIAGWTLVFLAVVLVRYFRFRRQGSPFPPIDSLDILFDEKGASGNSNKNWFTMIGGASGILWVTVTREEVWIRPRPFFLFRVFGADRSDLIHRISKRDVLSAHREPSRWGERVALEFAFADGRTRFFFLVLADPDKFIQAVKAG